jgi:hypothetical protein
MTFDLAAFLATAGVGRRIVHLKPNQVFFSQGDSADSIFYLQTGRAKLTVVSHDGKEATIAFSPPGNSLETSHWPAWVGCIWPLPVPLPPAQRSGLRGKR